VARRKPMSSEDRTALRQSRYMGAALSVEEYDELSADDSGNLGDEAVDNEGAKYDTAKLLRRLLRGLGVEVVAPTDPELMTMAARKIAELKSGAKPGGNNQRAKPGNPLVPGQEGAADVSPIYMSIMEGLRDEHERLALGLRDAQVALAAAPPPRLSAEEVERISQEMARRMGAVVEQGDNAALSMEDIAVQGFVDLVAKHGCER
jgi:hypothetical protein